MHNLFLLIHHLLLLLLLLVLSLLFAPPFLTPKVFVVAESTVFSSVASRQGIAKERTGRASIRM